MSQVTNISRFPTLEQKLREKEETDPTARALIAEALSRVNGCRILPVKKVTSRSYHMRVKVQPYAHYQEPREITYKIANMDNTGLEEARAREWTGSIAWIREHRYGGIYALISSCFVTPYPEHEDICRLLGDYLWPRIDEYVRGQLLDAVHALAQGDTLTKALSERDAAKARAAVASARHHLREALKAGLTLNDIARVAGEERDKLIVEKVLKS